MHTTAAFLIIKQTLNTSFRKRIYNTDNMRIWIQNASTSLNRMPTTDLRLRMKQREIFDSDDSVTCGETRFVADQTEISFKIAIQCLAVRSLCFYSRLSF